LPHLQVEFGPPGSVRVEAGLLRALVDELCSHETVDPRAVKAYLRPAEAAAFGEGHPAAFVHVTACLLAGRPEDLRCRIADGLLATLRRSYPDGSVGLTCEVRDLDRATYRK
jgi:5-carboxymethyl-2-hydroxymuconate isomerase